MFKKSNHTYQHILPVILIALLISGCKDGPFSTSENLVTVSGKVFYQNEAGGLIPVSDALIETKEHRTTARSYSDGQFVLRDIKPGIVTFVVTHDSYYQLEVPIEIKKSGNDSVDLIIPTDTLVYAIHGLVYDIRKPPRHSALYPHDLIYSGIAGVQVIIDGEEVALTDYQGRFSLEKISSTVLHITFSRPRWETITVEVDPKHRTDNISPYLQTLTPITEELYNMSVGNLWTYSYTYTEISEKYKNHTGQITWRVTGEHVDEEGKWYELEEHALYDIFTGMDHTYLRTHDKINNLTVRGIDFRWVFFDENNHVKHRLIKDVQIGSSDRVEEITIDGADHPVTGGTTNRYVYERNVGLVEWDYDYWHYNSEWRLIEYHIN